MPYSNNIFDVNWNKLVAWLIPILLCNIGMITALNAFVSPISYLHALFLQFRTSVQYRYSINYQTCYLQKLLNDTYDVISRRIVIVNNQQIMMPTTLYQESEGNPVKLYQESEGNPVILYQEMETGQYNVSFIIKIPAVVIYDVNELTALVYAYCLPTKTFKIDIV